MDNTVCAAGVRSKPVVLTCDTFGSWLRMEKEKRGMRIIDVEKISGVSRYSIGQYLTQDYSPTLSTVQLLAEAFGKKIVIVDKEAKV